jgi:hypothetical protein
MIDLPQDFFGVLHPQHQLPWFPNGCAQIRCLDNQCIGRQEILNRRRGLILRREIRHEQAGCRTAWGFRRSRTLNPG